MAEFTKYQRNIWKAEAVESIATSIGYELKSCESDIQYYQTNIEDRITDIKSQNRDDEAELIAEDWQITNNQKTIEQVKAKKTLWESLLKYVDKEMAF